MPYDNLIHTLLNIILPRKCAGCGLENEVFCEKCAEASYKKGTQCLICGFRNKDGKICSGHKLPIKQVIWAGRYDDELKEAVWQLKYKKRKELARPLAEMMWKKFIETFDNSFPSQQFARHGYFSAEKFLVLTPSRSQGLANYSPEDSPASKMDFLVIPIPLHFKKEYERGFNQAELLAREFAKMCNTECLTNVLIKVRETPAQVEVENKELRIKNLENAFRVNLNISPNPLLVKKGSAERGWSPTIILIDDVSTTGATLFHAASALEKAGAKRIIGLVLAHGG